MSFVKKYNSNNQYKPNLWCPGINYSYPMANGLVAAYLMNEGSGGKIFDLSGFAAGVLLIQSSMPSAILTYLIASMYSPKEIVDNIASMIVVSTLMSLVTVPIIVFIALKYFS